MDRGLEAGPRREAERPRARRDLAADAPQELHRALVLRDLARGGEPRLQQPRVRRKRPRVAHRELAAVRERAQRQRHSPERARLELAHPRAPPVHGLLELALVAVVGAPRIRELRLDTRELVGERVARLGEVRVRLGELGIEARDAPFQLLAARDMAAQHTGVVEVFETHLLLARLGAEPDARRELAARGAGAAPQRREKLLAVGVGRHRITPRRSAAKAPRAPRRGAAARAACR